ncbi:hypothetical protein SB48_HM08orf06352 [Heyndrickxia coagulans]|uniref:Uncharacterized protein n=1 Tax=Heyndrickxia coagulans TaxID=1398 RepID=A0A0C5CDB5_HEYCO|nr:hypothetical protein SB48_HM08orf06352 [Heyndrickxia coagulans]KYC72321.1 hypothetical protein B4099_3683 [Heyndrickxia coagulans]
MKKKWISYSSVNRYFKKVFGRSHGWFIETTDAVIIIKDYDHSRLIDHKQEIKSKLGVMLA